MDAILNVALPIFGIIALGYGSGQIRLLGEASAEALNRFVFFIALPPAMFIFTARAGINEILNWPYLAGFVTATLLTVAIAVIVARVAFRVDGCRAAFHGFIACFANYGYMGIPFFLAAYGSEGVLPAIVTSLVAGIPTMILIMAALEVLGSGGSGGGLARGIWRIFARNPLFIATGLGVVFSVYELPVPLPLGNMLEMLAMTAGPAALFALGLSLVGHSVLGDLGEMAWLVVMKLAVQPLVTWLVLTRLFTVDPFWVSSGVILAAMPLGSTAFLVAQQYGVAMRLSSAAVAVSTMASILTLTGVMLLLEPG